MRILVTGAGGLLGGELQRVLSRDPALLPTLPAPPADHHLVALTRADLDVTDAAAVRHAVRRHAPDAVLHCAAWTDVDGAEARPREARRVNVEGAAHVARAATAAGAVMVYPSTDFVFDGEKDEPYLPDDPPRPLSEYGRTKREGEEVVRAAGPDHLVVRTSWVYGTGGGGFVRTVLDAARAGRALRVVDDQVSRPTWSRNLAAVLLELVEGGARGTWHVADAGTVSRHGLALELLEMAGLETEVEAVSSDEFGAVAPRPRWSVLDTAATEARLGRPMVPWREALRRWLAEGAGGPDA